MKFHIRPYANRDEAAALRLESRCSQGRSLKVRFRRPSFAARSSLYEEAHIVAAETDDGVLAGLAAWASKEIRLGGTPVRASYHYDLRVDPAFRGRRLARRLCVETLRQAAATTDCHYMLAAAGNDRLAALVDRAGIPNAIFPLTYVVIPVPGGLRPGRILDADPGDVRSASLSCHDADWISPPIPDDHDAAVGSFATANRTAGVSVWSGDGYLREEIEALPHAWAAMRALLRLVPHSPQLPGPGEAVRTWFLYDLYARDARALRPLVRGVLRLARERDRRAVCALLPRNDPRIEWLARSALWSFRIDYSLVVGGPRIPEAPCRMHVDPRDL